MTTVTTAPDVRCKVCGQLVLATVDGAPSGHYNGAARCAGSKPGTRP